MRHLPRIFRRAGFALFYSEGFHPKPELSFGPALGLGIPSLGELVDVTLVDDVAPDELLRRLARVTLDGIEFLERGARSATADRPVGGVIAEAEYAARLPDDVDVAPRVRARAAAAMPLPVLRDVREEDRPHDRRAQDVARRRALGRRRRAPPAGLGRRPDA